MPITLITGLPGHGKTLYALARWKDEAAKLGRPVFHNNINGLNIPGWQPWELDNWQNLPAGAIMIVDEAQFSFPTRGRGAPDPWVEKLTTHRHLGLDFVVITQNPMLLDSYVRRLVDRHFHVIRKFGTHMVTIHEFTNGTKENVGQSRDGSIRHEWRFPKEVFELYKSAELHTVKARIPMRVWVMLCTPVIFIALAFLAYSRLNPAAQQAAMDERLGLSSVTHGAGSASRAGPGGLPASPARESLSPLEYAQLYLPRVEGLPHTAPAYDEVTQPVAAPYPAACIASQTRCVCASQQGTKLDTPPALCRQIANGGFFVAWANRADQAIPIARQSEPSKPETVAVAKRW